MKRKNSSERWNEEFNYDDREEREAYGRFMQNGFEEIKEEYRRATFTIKGQ